MVMPRTRYVRALAWFIFNRPLNVYRLHRFSETFLAQVYKEPLHVHQFIDKCTVTV